MRARSVVRTLMRLPAGVALNPLLLVLIRMGVFLLLEAAPASPLVALLGKCERTRSRILLAGLLRAVITDGRVCSKSLSDARAVDRAPLGGNFEPIKPLNEFCSQVPVAV